MYYAGCVYTHFVYVVHTPNQSSFSTSSPYRPPTLHSNTHKIHRNNNLLSAFPFSVTHTNAHACIYTPKNIFNVFASTTHTHNDLMQIIVDGKTKCAAPYKMYFILFAVLLKLFRKRLNVLYCVSIILVYCAHQRIRRCPAYASKL